MTHLRLLALTLALAAPAAAQTTSTPAAPATPAPVTAAPALPQGQVNIAVGTFRCKASKCSSDLGDGISDALTTALLNTGKFAVYERENTGQLTEEAFLSGGAAFEGADLLIFGSITQYEPEASGGGINVLGFSLGQKKSTIAMDLRIVDVKTRRIIGGTQVKGEAQGNSFSMSGMLPLNLGVGVKASPQIEAAINTMLNDAVQQLLLKVPAGYYRN